MCPRRRSPDLAETVDRRSPGILETYRPVGLRGRRPAHSRRSHGHIVLRVPPGGDEYRVMIVDDTSESHSVIKVCGPYRSH